MCYCYNSLDPGQEKISTVGFVPQICSQGIRYERVKDRFHGPSANKTKITEPFKIHANPNLCWNCYQFDLLCSSNTQIQCYSDDEWTKILIHFVGQNFNTFASLLYIIITVCVLNANIKNINMELFWSVNNNRLLLFYCFQVNKIYTPTHFRARNGNSPLQSIVNTRLFIILFGYIYMRVYVCVCFHFDIMYT